MLLFAFCLSPFATELIRLTVILIGKPRHPEKRYHNFKHCEQIIKLFGRNFYNGKQTRK